MSKIKRKFLQTPLDLLIEKQGKIDNLFTFLKDNNLDKYNDYYYKTNINVVELKNDITSRFIRNNITVANFGNKKGDFNNDFNNDFSITA